MKKVSKFLLLGLLLPTLCSAKQVCQHEPGTVTCGEGSVPSLSVNGVARLKGTTVENLTEVNGTLQASATSLSSVSVNGTAKINDSRVEHSTEVNGTLSANNTQFLDLIRLSSSSSRLEKCVTQDILIEDVQAREQKLYLVSSTIKGNITFNGKGGKVYLCKKSSFSGKVIGGVLIDHC